MAQLPRAPGPNDCCIRTLSRLHAELRAPCAELPVNVLEEADEPPHGSSSRLGCLYTVPYIESRVQAPFRVRRYHRVADPLRRRRPSYCQIQ